NGCPTAKSCEDRLIAQQEAYGSRGLQLVAINSNNPYLSPPDTLARMSLRAAEKGFNFPYLKDETGAAARAYGATHTPTVVLFDGNRRLRYRGRIDDARHPARVTRHDLQQAIDDLLAGRPVEVPETQAFGCSIVWRGLQAWAWTSKLIDSSPWRSGVSPCGLKRAHDAVAVR